MDHHTLLVISDPTDPLLGMLEGLPPETTIAAGNTAEAFQTAAPDADAILNWSFSNRTLREILPLCPRLRWVQTRTAGLDNMLFPALIESPVQVTNGSGVYSQSLGEFALAAILTSPRTCGA